MLDLSFDMRWCDNQMGISKCSKPKHLDKESGPGHLDKGLGLAMCSTHSKGLVISHMLPVLSLNGSDRHQFSRRVKNSLTEPFWSVCINSGSMGWESLKINGSMIWQIKLRFSATIKHVQIRSLTQSDWSDRFRCSGSQPLTWPFLFRVTDLDNTACYWGWVRSCGFPWSHVRGDKHSSSQYCTISIGCHRGVTRDTECTSAK
jgi:hypothetical protein